MCALPSRFIKERNKVSNISTYCREHWHVQHGWFPKWLIVEGISVKADKTRKESRGRVRVKESYRKSKEMMPSVDLPNNGNVWQTTEPVKGRPTMYQQVISIIGKLNHRILPAQVTSLSFSTSLFSPVKLQSSNCQLLDSHIIHVLPKHAPHYIRMYVLDVLLHN